jgi:hypothetical protein
MVVKGNNMIKNFLTLFAILSFYSLTTLANSEANLTHHDDETYPVLICKSIYHRQPTEVPLYSDTPLDQTVSLATYLKNIQGEIYVALPNHQYGVRLDRPVVLLELKKSVSSNPAQWNFSGLANGSTIKANYSGANINTTIKLVNLVLSRPENISDKKFKKVQGVLSFEFRGTLENKSPSSWKNVTDPMVCSLANKKALQKYPSLK